MYFKLAIRNAKRSLLDYLLYLFSMTALVSVICLSNCIAEWGHMRAGLQTMSLPLLVVMVMTVLANYINTFLVRQRAKEFATYMLLGMEKKKLALTFLCELSVMGLVCFLLGVIFGTAVYAALFCFLPVGAGSQPLLGVTAKGVLQTLGYFLLVEVLSVFFMGRKIYRLQIIQLMGEKRRNQPFAADRKAFWGWMLVGSLFCYMTLLSVISAGNEPNAVLKATGGWLEHIGECRENQMLRQLAVGYLIAFIPEKLMAAAISVIAVPMLWSVFSFYQWLYACLASVRLSGNDVLYQGDRLYRLAQMTTSSRTSVCLNTVFGICLIFSAGSFVLGLLLMNPDIRLFGREQQLWMGFSQMGICLVFMIVYFSVLALRLIIDMRGETNGLRLLLYMGKTRPELKCLVCRQALVQLLLPTLMPFALLWVSVPFVCRRVGSLFQGIMGNLLPWAMAGFMCCFFVLYICWFGMVCAYRPIYISGRKFPSSHQ